jgi:deoxyribodipyrimidine photolyase-related protein
MRRWLFGDQLGPQFLDSPDQPVLMVESKAVFRRRRFHRAKAQLILSAMRHRAAELGDQCLYLQTETYGEALAQVSEDLDVIQPTSRAADRFVRERGIPVLPGDRAFATTREDFATYAAGKRSLLLEDFYRWQRRRFEVLMDGSEPTGGRWNFDQDNREPPPKRTTLDVPERWWPEEDAIDHGVREDLDRWEAEGIEFLGEDSPRWSAATREEALKALHQFVSRRLQHFGPHEDAMLAEDPWMAHSGLSAALNLGLLHPLECVEAAEKAYRAGDAHLGSVEGYVRQVLGWREYVWSVYWHAPADYPQRNALQAHGDVPGWWWELDATQELEANCLKHVMADVRQRGWVHHIPRLMVLSSYALQRGWQPSQVTAWFHQAFVDGYEWVMAPNVVGLSQHADGGLMATKPYTSGGAYLDKMSDYCGGCRYDPKKRVGEDACPFTAGYWSFLDRNTERLAGNQRLAQPLAGLKRLKDLDALVAQERDRGNSPP